MYKILITPLEQVGKFSNIFTILEEGNCQIIKSPYPHPLKEKDLLPIIKGIDAI